MNVKTFAAAVAMTVASVAAANAAPLINGTIGMAFSGQAEDATGANVALGSATGIDFAALNLSLNAGPIVAGNNGAFGVTNATGDIAASGIVPLSVGTIQDFFFSPLGPSSPILGFFSVGGLSFDLASISINTQTNLTLGLSGAGTMHLAGFDPTPGTWGFSMNTNANQLTGTFSWSADAVAVVPEPASLALLGTGLLGLGALARRRRRRASAA